MRRPAYMPTPVPTMLAMNAVMIPTRAPSHQPTALPRLAPRNVNSLDTAPYLLTHPACRHAAVSVNERDLPDGEDRPAFRRDAVDSEGAQDRKSTRLNSSHLVISYAVFCLKKKKKHIMNLTRITQMRQ